MQLPIRGGASIFGPPLVQGHMPIPTPIPKEAKQQSPEMTQAELANRLGFWPFNYAAIH